MFVWVFVPPTGSADIHESVALRDAHDTTVQLPWALNVSLLSSP